MASLKEFETVAIDSGDAEFALNPIITSKVNSGSFLLFFVFSLVCRFCQRALFASVQFGSPQASWFASDAALFFLPAAALAIPVAARCMNSANNVLIVSSIVLAIGLEIIVLFLNGQVFTFHAVVTAIILVTICLEAAKISTHTQIVKLDLARGLQASSAKIIILEVIAVTFGIYFYDLVNNSISIPRMLSISSLVLTLSVLAGLMKLPYEYQSNNSKSFQRLVKGCPLTHIIILPVAHAAPLTILFMAITGKLSGNLFTLSLWQWLAVGWLFGAFTCMSPLGHFFHRNWFVALVLSLASCTLCIYQPAGYILSTGLFLSGFASTTAVLCNSTSISQMREGNILSISQASYQAFQTIVGYTMCYAMVWLVEPKIEALSSSALVRIIFGIQLFAVLIAIFALWLGSFLRKPAQALSIISTRPEPTSPLGIL